LREIIFSHGTAAKVKNILREVSGATFSPKVERLLRRGCQVIAQSRTSGDEAAVTFANALRTTPSTSQPTPATDEAKEWGEVSAADYPLALE
jgi:hypothetical protein